MTTVAPPDRVLIRPFPVQEPHQPSPPNKKARKLPAKSENSSPTYSALHHIHPLGSPSNKGLRRRRWGRGGVGREIEGRRSGGELRGN